MRRIDAKEASEIFKSQDKKFKGFFSIYIHFFNILDKDISKVSSLIGELKSEISTTSCERLELADIDVSYVRILARDMKGMEDPESVRPFMHLLAMLKWFYRNSRVTLEDSKLYNDLSKSSRSTIVVESEEYTHEKLRLVLKSIDSEMKLMTSILDKVKLLPSYRGLIYFTWGVLRSVKIPRQVQKFARVLKSEEACCVIQALFDKFCDIDIFNNFKASVDEEGVVAAICMLTIDLTEDLSDYVSDLEVSVKTTTDYTEEELQSLNRDLRNKYKELRSLKYQEEFAATKDTEESFQAEIEEIVNEKTYKNDFGLSLQDKKELLSTSSFLLLKSDDITIVPVMDNVRVESIATVSNETLKLDYDAVVILTKNIWHADVFRVKSMIGNTPIIYTNRTNRKLIIEDIYNQF